LNVENVRFLRRSLFFFLKKRAGTNFCNIQ